MRGEGSGESGGGGGGGRQARLPIQACPDHCAGGVATDHSLSIHARTPFTLLYSLHLRHLLRLTCTFAFHGTMENFVRSLKEAKVGELGAWAGKNISQKRIKAVVADFNKSYQAKYVYPLWSAAIVARLMVAHSATAAIILTAAAHAVTATSHTATKHACEQYCSHYAQPTSITAPQQQYTPQATPAPLSSNCLCLFSHC